MSFTENAQNYMNEKGIAAFAQLHETDPEFADFFASFAYDEVIAAAELDDRTRFMVILAASIGTDGKELFEMNLKPALNAGVTLLEMREIVYQATAYTGFGRTLPFIRIFDAFCASEGVPLPLEDMGTVTYEERGDRGEDKQVELFGPRMRGFRQNGAKDIKINQFLSANCFGDYYTRKGLTNCEREMITFCFLAAQGGCMPQCTAHADANLKTGNSLEKMLAVITNMVPYIGYPKSLNAITCLRDGYAVYEKGLAQK